MTKLTQNSWLGGQMDVQMAGRQDMRNYRNGASVLKNFVPVKLGSIRKRPGTDLVCDLTDFIHDADSGRDPATTKFRMIPLGFLSNEGLVLVIVSDASGKCSARTYRAKAPAAGDGSHEAGHGSYFDVSGDVPYKADELDQIGYVQCGDIVFLAHKGHPPAQVEHDIRDGAHVFTYRESPVNRVVVAPTITHTTLSRCAVAKNQRGGYQQEKYAATAVVEIDGLEYESSLSRVYSEPGAGDNNYENEKDNDGSSSEKMWIAQDSTAYYLPWTASQNIRITVDGSACEKPGVTLKKINLYKDSGGMFGLIASVARSEWVSVREINLIDSNIAADTSVSPMEKKEVFDDADSYPGCVGLYQQRLVWAGTAKDPARIWMSQAGDLYENRPHETLQVNDAIDFILPITQFANINFIVELGRLFVFAETSELVVGSNSDSAGVSYETIMASEHSHLGCTKRLPPIIANNSLLFVSRTGDSVRDYDINISNSRFGGTDVSIFSSSTFADNPIVDWTWQHEPNSTVWCVLADGRLASFTYVKEQEIAAWAVHELGGGGKALAIAKTCAIFGREAGRPTTGEVMVAVEREGSGIGDQGSGKRITLERMRPWGARRSEELRVESEELCMDCVESGRVAGKTVVELEDGTAVSGFTFESVMTTMPPIIGSEVGQAQFDIKLGQHAHVRTIGSKGGEIFAVGMEDSPSPIEGIRDLGSGIGDVDVVLAGSNNRDGRVTVRHDAPWPFQLVLLELDYEVES